MRFKRITIFLTLCVLIWGTVTYFAFLNRPINSKDNSKTILDGRIHKLELDLREQFSLNKEVIDNLNSVIKVKKEDLQSSRVDEIEPVRSDFKGTVIPVLVFACNRVTVGRCLDKLIEYRPNSDQFPIIVSQVHFDT